MEKKQGFWKIFGEGLLKGIAWAFGVTVGFAIISTLLVILLRQAGGMPLVGDWVASVVEATIQNLTKRTPVVPQ